MNHWLEVYRDLIALKPRKCRVEGCLPVHGKHILTHTHITDYSIPAQAWYSLNCEVNNIIIVSWHYISDSLPA